MKRFVLAGLAMFLFGCSSAQVDRFDAIVDDPSVFLKDPHTTDFDDQMGALESRYLKKEISYADYLEQKKELEENYARDVQKRRDVVESTNVR